MNQLKEVLEHLSRDSNEVSVFLVSIVPPLFIYQLVFLLATSASFRISRRKLEFISQVSTIQLFYIVRIRTKFRYYYANVTHFLSISFHR